MASRKGVGVAMRTKSIRWRACSPLIGLLALIMIVSLVLFSLSATSSNSGFSNNEFGDVYFSSDKLDSKVSALEQIESLIPKKVFDAIYSKPERSVPFDLKVLVRKDPSSSLIQREETGKEKALDDLKKGSFAQEQRIDEAGEVAMRDELKGRGVLASTAEESNEIESDAGQRSTKVQHFDESNESESDAGQRSTKDAESDAKVEHDVVDKSTEVDNNKVETEDVEKIKEVESRKDETETIDKSKDVDTRKDENQNSNGQEDPENSDTLVRLMRDQLIMARAYTSIAESSKNFALAQDLKVKIKDLKKIVGDANVNSDLPSSAKEEIQQMGHLLLQAQDQHQDNAFMVKKLQEMLRSSEEHARTLKKESAFLSQLAAKTIPKSLHCLSMLLTVEFHTRPLEKQTFPPSPKLEDPSLYHYALFSDNILAAAVVVNSTISHAKEPEKHVFHLVTDKMNFGAMKMWFLENPPGKATIQVGNVDDFKWLNASYCPVLQQLESNSMKQFYFKADNAASGASSNMKFRNPKYLSMLNHLRFYLPETYPKLDKILFLDDDIVVQKDLSGLWNVDLQGNVNGAVETCGTTFHRFDKYLNFENPIISANFDPKGCGWAYGMNMFDLVEWKKRDITGIYHKWQRLNEDRTLWNLGTLPPGLITFYNSTFPLDKWWHVLGLGYNPKIPKRDIEKAAVVHYNGNMKPWLEIGMSKYKLYWSKYVKYDHPFLQQCNINV